MLAPALRRFVQVLVAIGVATAAVSALLGLLADASISRSIAIGFYLVGSFLLFAGFFLGNRGPVRPKGEEDAVGGDIIFRLPSRRLRWATAKEHEEAISTAAVFLPIGLVLILLGIASDSQHALF